MAEPVAIVGLIDRLVDGDVGATARAPRTETKRPAGRPGREDVLSVVFVDGQVGLLDLTEPRAPIWASVLRELHERQKPAYVEIDPRTGVINELLQPKLQPVAKIGSVPDGKDLLVDLSLSHARHILRSGQPRFDQLLRRLRSAQRRKTPVWVTETLDTHEIIDVRPE